MLQLLRPDGPGSHASGPEQFRPARPGEQRPVGGIKTRRIAQHDVGKRGIGQKALLQQDDLVAPASPTQLLQRAPVGVLIPVIESVGTNQRHTGDTAETIGGELHPAHGLVVHHAALHEPLAHPLGHLGRKTRSRPASEEMLHGGSHPRRMRLRPAELSVLYPDDFGKQRPLHTNGR